MAPRVSVAIPTYNSADYLREAIESVLAQEYQDFDLIVYDNASGDTHQLDKISALALNELQQNQASLPELNELVATTLSIESDSELSIYLDKVISNLHRLDLIEPAFD